jgi:hypothetical protein
MVDAAALAVCTGRMENMDMRYSDSVVTVSSKWGQT